MGVQPYLLSNSLIGLVAQRLVRALSGLPALKADDYEHDFLKLSGEETATLYRQLGDKCSYEGYKGRMVFTKWSMSTMSCAG